jgi:hypothetical protein
MGLQCNLRVGALVKFKDGDKADQWEHFVVQDSPVFLFLLGTKSGALGGAAPPHTVRLKSSTNYQ